MSLVEVLSPHITLRRGYVRDVASLATRRHTKIDKAREVQITQHMRLTLADFRVTRASSLRDMNLWDAEQVEHGAVLLLSLGYTRVSSGTVMDMAPGDLLHLSYPHVHAYFVVTHGRHLAFHLAPDDACM